MVSCRSFSDSCRPIRDAALALLAWLVVAPIVVADDVALPLVTVLTVEGLQAEGGLKRLDDEGVQLDDGTAKTLPLESVVSLQLGSNSEPPQTSGNWLLFANGDRIAAEAVRFDGEFVQTRPNRGIVSDEWQVPVEVLSAMTWSLDGSRLARMQSRLQPGELREDLLLLANADRVTGELIEFDERTVTIETSVGEIPVERSRLAGLAFNPDLVVAPAAPVRGAVIGFHDGSRLTVQSARFIPDSDDAGRDTIEVEPLFGDSIRLSLAAVSSIELLRPDLRCLTEVDPADVTIEQTPYLSSAPPPVWNDSVAGSPLRLRGGAPARGIGVLSGTTLTFALQPGDESFLAIVGIDDAAEGQGSARFSILLDGKEAWTSSELTGRDDPVVAGPIDLAGASELTLRVDFGAYGDIRDFADWCTPVIVRTPTD
ncbi:MAG: NPCBM/NEW2 domain-containing protein [Maioricimonas sp. JB045]